MISLSCTRCTSWCQCRRACSLRTYSPVPEDILRVWMIIPPRTFMPMIIGLHWLKKTGAEPGVSFTRNLLRLKKFFLCLYLSVFICVYLWLSAVTFINPQLPVQFLSGSSAFSLLFPTFKRLNVPMPAPECLPREHEHRAVFASVSTRVPASRGVFERGSSRVWFSSEGLYEWCSNF
jgi:hypothetical protein